MQGHNLICDTQRKGRRKCTCERASRPPVWLVHRFPLKKGRGSLPQLNKQKYWLCRSQMKSKFSITEHRFWWGIPEILLDSTNIGESLSPFYPVQDEWETCGTISLSIFGFWWNNYFILVSYKFYSIMASAKRTFVIFCAFKFSW